MRRTLVALAAAVPLLLTAAPAAAAPPEPVPPGDDMVVTACGTDILIQEVVQKERIHKNGRFTGRLVIRLTNLGTGASTTVNASGPGFGGESFDESTGLGTFTFDAKGQNLIFPHTPGEAELLTAAGLPQLFTSSGPISLTGVFDPALEDVVSLTVNRRPPRIRDLCAELT